MTKTSLIEIEVESDAPDFTVTITPNEAEPSAQPEPQTGDISSDNPRNA